MSAENHASDANAGVDNPPSGFREANADSLADGSHHEPKGSEPASESHTVSSAVHSASPLTKSTRTATFSVPASNQKEKQRSKDKPPRLSFWQRIRKSASTMHIPERKIGNEPGLFESIWAILRNTCMFGYFSSA